ncbi:MAG: sugar ABC transporter permease [Verrucomicrobia bacterium]|jgi:multiple sugar transport system permease protein|nr:sugar ABC transporter permease [Gammaproteobacteria bacterium]MBT4622545.1 sugar ABC transporter permease [Verrucomicrobiota bacterium]MBT6097847.1 sugar ABC transporter permease [Marinovum sp.]MBT6526784.1 sugar ABC transporter permease [Marinovum sp.]
MTVSTSYKGHPALSDQDWGFSTISEMPATMNPAPSRMFYVYLAAPAIILLAAITIYPFLWLIYMSFHKVGFGAAGDVFVGVENFSRLFSDARYIEGWGLLAKYSAICLSIQVVVGVTLAVVLNNSRHEKVLVTLFLMPMMVSPVVAGLLFYYLYNGTFGWYHWIFQSIGLLGETSILGSTKTALYGIILVDVWQWTPLITLITLAGLKRVPQDQLEANMVDGAGSISNFFHVSLPNIYPFLLIAVLLRFMDNFRFIDAILALTGGGPSNSTRLLPVYLFDVSFQFFKLGRGAAIALTLLIVTIILGMILVRVLEDPARKKALQGDTDN